MEQGSDTRAEVEVHANTGASAGANVWRHMEEAMVDIHISRKLREMVILKACICEPAILCNIETIVAEKTSGCRWLIYGREES